MCIPLPFSVHPCFIPPAGCRAAQADGVRPGPGGGLAHSPLPLPSVGSGTAAFLLKGTLLVDLGPHPLSIWETEALGKQGTAKAFSG